MKRMLRSLAAVIAIAMVVVAAPGTPVVTATKFRITRGELDKAYLTYVLTQKAFLNIDVAPVFEKEIRKRLLDELILTRLAALRADATDLNQAKLKADEIYKSQRENWATDFAFKLAVEATGLTMTEFKRQLHDEALRELVAKRELRVKTAPKPGDILKYYNDHRAEWNVPETANVAQIFFSKFDLATGRKLNPKEILAKHQTAAEVAAKVKSGIDFKKLVNDFSEDPISKPNGGEFQMVKGVGDPKLSTEVFKLNVNNAKLVETDLGFHVVWMKERKPARVKKIDEVRNEIRKLLQAKNFARELPKYFERIKQQAGVKILPR